MNGAEQPDIACGGAADEQVLNGVAVALEIASETNCSICLMPSSDGIPTCAAVVVGVVGVCVDAAVAVGVIHEFVAHASELATHARGGVGEC